MASVPKCVYGKISNNTWLWATPIQYRFSTDLRYVVREMSSILVDRFKFPKARLLVALCGELRLLNILVLNCSMDLDLRLPRKPRQFLWLNKLIMTIDCSFLQTPRTECNFLATNVMKLSGVIYIKTVKRRSTYTGKSLNWRTPYSCLFNRMVKLPDKQSSKNLFLQDKGLPDVPRRIAKAFSWLHRRMKYHANNDTRWGNSLKPYVIEL